jgi:hypothetical protein
MLSEQHIKRDEGVVMVYVDGRIDGTTQKARKFFSCPHTKIESFIHPTFLYSSYINCYYVMCVKEVDMKLVKFGHKEW